MCQTDLLDLTHEIDRGRERRSKPGLLPAPRSDNDAGGGRCAACSAQTSIAPMASEYCGNGVIHHHWLCHACGHQWIAVVHVPA